MVEFWSVSFSFGVWFCRVLSEIENIVSGIRVWDIKNEHVGFGWKPFRWLGSEVIGSVIFWAVEWDICEGLKGFHYCWSCCYWWCFLDGRWRSSWDWVCMKCGVKDKWNLNGIERDRTQVSYSMVRDFTSWGTELIGTHNLLHGIVTDIYHLSGLWTADLDYGTFEAAKQTILINSAMSLAFIKLNAKWSPPT